MIEIVFAFACADCGQPKYQRWRFLIGTAEPPVPALPVGWSQVGEKLYCARHVVKAGAVA